MRGKGLSELAHTKKARITPACAGKTTSVLPSTLPATDHPRVCGENFQDLAAQYEKAGSPPRVRGKLEFYEYSLFRPRITPACAGKTHGKNPRAVRIRDHPRVCGENRRRTPPRAPSRGSPPRVRGKLRTRVASSARMRITPACAGKTSSAKGIVRVEKDHPRVCGENLNKMLHDLGIQGSPPRVRGKSLFALVKTVEGRITPACAGKILTTPAIRCPIVDHPRVCGENMGGASKKEASPGSPPRVRGKWDGDYMDKRSFGITPACAGKIRRA